MAALVTGMNMKKTLSLSQSGDNSTHQVITILLVDDDENVRNMLASLLQDSGYNVLASDCGTRALEILARHPADLALLDYELPDMNGIELMTRLREISPSLLSLIITGYGTIERAVEAMQSGAWDFVSKPITSNMLLEKLERIKHYCQLRREHDVRNKVLQQDFQFSGLPCESAAMHAVYEAVLRAAESHLPVLIEGETGVGKEHVAEAVHLNSKRKNYPYIVMDCTATPESLIESTLFGSTKGAFTGSVERKGLLQAADGGSLLLDEVGEIALDIQPKLLRCLETKRFRPVGSTKECDSDFRIICSTNRDLLEETNKGEFRSDLFYRISAIRIQVPPLRERPSDIPVLADYFLKESARYNERENMSFTPEALHTLSLYDWPGNIRQLKFVIEASLFRTSKDQIGIQDLQLEGFSSPPKEPPVASLDSKAMVDKDFKTFRDEAILEAERCYLSALLEKNGGDVRISAQEAGLTREALYRVMSRCGISPNQFRLKKN